MNAVLYFIDSFIFTFQYPLLASSLENLILPDYESIQSSTSGNENTSFCDFVQCSTVHIPPNTPVSFADEYRGWGPFGYWWFSHICIDHLFKVFLFFPCKTKWFASEVLFNRLGITCINTMFNCSKVAYIILISRKHLWIIDQHCFEFLLFW